MAARTHGTVVRWNDERGFGFIQPAGAADEVFVHISAFPRDGQRPRAQEMVSFETEGGPNGKPRAVRVQRPGNRPPARVRLPVGSASRRRVPVGGIMLLVAIVAGIYGYRTYSGGNAAAKFGAGLRDAGAPAVPLPTQASFACDGRQHCSQMASCEEASYFAAQCPGTMMDGDRDGKPCEDRCGH